MSERIETESEVICLGEDGIIRVWLKPLDHQLADAIRYIETAATLCQNQRRPALIDIKQLKTITHDARQYYAGENAVRVHNAVALLVESNFSKIIANFFLGLNKTQFSLRVFINEKEAINWLKPFVYDQR